MEITDSQEKNETLLINNDKKFEKIATQPIRDLYSVWFWLTTVYDYFDENQRNKYWFQKIGQNKSKGMAHLKDVYEKKNLSILGDILKKYEGNQQYLALEYTVTDLLYEVLQSVKEGAEKAKTGYTKTPFFRRGLNNCISLVNRKYAELHKNDHVLSKGFYERMNMPQNKEEWTRLAENNKLKKKK